MATVHPLRAPGADPKQEIKAAIDEFFRAFESKDVDRILACYAPDVVAFDMMPPLQIKGADAWREIWSKAMSSMTGEIRGEMADLHIDVEGDLAACHALNHFRMTGERNEEVWFRWTAIFRRLGGRWLMTHEHNSVPGDMETGKALMDLKPE